MSDPSLELQKAIVEYLQEDADIAAVINGRVYDRAPGVNAVFPQITLGDCQVLPDKADCIDGAEVFLTIDGWSREPGETEIKKLGKAVVAALDDFVELDVNGFDVVVFEFESLNYLRDPDGLTTHASITFRGLLQPAS